MSQVESSVADQEREFQLLLSRSKVGDDNAINALLQQAWGTLIPVANEQTPDWLRAATAPSEFVQMSLIDLHQVIGRFEGPLPGWRAYARKILENKIKSAIRKWRPVDRPSREPPPSPGAPVREEELLSRFQEIRAGLKPEYQTVLNLWDEGLPWKQVGAHMERSAEAARQLWTRAFEELSRQAQAAGLIDQLPDHHRRR